MWVNHHFTVTVGLDPSLLALIGRILDAVESRDKLKADAENLKQSNDALAEAVAANQPK